MRWSLTYSVATATVLVAALFIVTLLNFSQRSVEELITGQMGREIGDVRREVARAADEKLLTLGRNLTDLARNTLVANALVDDVGRDLYLQAFLSGYREIDGIPVTLCVTNYRGVIIASSGGGGCDTPVEGWAASIVAREQGDARVVQSNGEVGVILGTPVVFANTGTAEGALVLRFNLADLLGSDAVRRRWSGVDSISGVRMGVAVAGGGTSVVLGDRREGAVVNPPPPASVALPFNLTTSVEVDHSREPVARAVTELQRRYLAIGGVALAGALLIGVLLSLLMTRRLARLTEGTRSVIREDRPVARLTVDGSDEVGQLGEAFNTVLDQLAAAQERIRSQAAERIQESESQLQAIFDNSEVGIMLLRGESGVLRSNRRLAEILGYADAEEMVGLDLRCLHLSDEDFRTYDETYQHALTTGEQRHVEYPLRRKDGGVVWCELSGKALDPEFPADLEKGVIWVVDDITERKEMEQRLRESEARYRSVVESLREGIVVQNREGMVVAHNASALRILGLSPEQLLGRSSIGGGREALHEDGSPFPGEGHPAMVALHSGKGVRDVVMGLSKPGGEWVWVTVNAEPLAEEEGRAPYAVVTSFSDVTERRVMESNLLAAKLSAEQANRAKSAFLATMSHEIRTPMNAILGVADLLAETSLDEEQEHYVSLFTSAGENLLQIINDILDISKIEAGQVELERRPFSLKKVAYDARDILHAKAEEKGVRLLIHGFEELPDFLLGDQVRIRQVLINLLGNAVKFTEAGTVALLVEGVPLGGGGWAATFYVVDTGIGIGEEQRQLVFQEFSQADSTITRRFGGTGLGLSICKRLVELMGGRLSLHSREGHGSTFSFTIPLAEADTIPERVKDTLLEGVHVLSVHDHPIHRNFYEEIMVDWGGGVVALEAETEMASRIVAALREREIDLILVHHERLAPDLLLEMLSDVRQTREGRGVPLVLCGRPQEREVLARLRELGVVYIADSHDDEVLRRGLKLALRRRAGLIKVQRSVSAAAPVRILLAEDGEDNVALFKAFVGKLPHRIDVATDGDEAVRLFTGGAEYDLVFMDVQMPNKDGYTATREIRAWERANGRRETPILALTAHALTEHVEMSREAGCSGHLNKPIKKRLLLETIARYA